MEPFDLRQCPFFETQPPTTGEAIVDQIVIDSRRIYSPRALFVALPGTHTDGHHHLASAASAGARFCLIRDDWQGSIPASIIPLRVPCPLSTLQEIAEFYRHSKSAVVIAIAGGFGKTMLKDFLHELMSQEQPCAVSPESFNSQIGVALSLLTLRESDKFALIETGISKQGEMQRLAAMVAPDHTLVTGIGKRYEVMLGTFNQAVVEIKTLLDATRGWTLGPLSIPLPFHHFWDRPNSALPHYTQQLDFPSGSSFSPAVHCLHGYYSNLLNAACKSAYLLGISEESIRQCVDHFIPEPLRTEIWQPESGPKFINDRYSADPLSIEQALWQLRRHSQKGKQLFVFGGLRGQNTSNDYERVAQSIEQQKVDILHLVGEVPIECRVPIMKHADYDSALRSIKESSSCEDTILIKGSKKISLHELSISFDQSPLISQCTVNLAAIRHNLQVIRRAQPNVRLMPIVKASAYGTQEQHIAQFLHECGIDILGVAYVDEGIALKRKGAKQDIFCLHVFPEEADKAVRWGFQLGVSSEDEITALESAAKKQGTRVLLHLHVDTGMARLGCRPEIALDLAKKIASSTWLKLEGIMTHFIGSDDPNFDNRTKQQAQTLEAIINQCEELGIEIPWRHASNSSASLRFQFPSFNMVRIGLVLYGLSRTGYPLWNSQLRLAISLTTKIVGINISNKGETVGYNGQFKTVNDLTRIGVIPIGYHDGLHRHYRDNTRLLVRGSEVPIAGNICMDYTMLDLSCVPDAVVGDTVLIFGEDDAGHLRSPSEIAISGNTIVHELISCLGPRIPRIFIEEERP